MPNIYITEVTGGQQVVGPDISQNFIASGTDYGDTITVSTNPQPIRVGVSVIQSPENISITGTHSGDNIDITIIEAVYPTGSGVSTGPFSTRFYYSGDGKLIQKSIGAVDTTYTYNIDDTLNEVVHPDYTKAMLYNTDGVLTGFNVS